jgi:hypothetical protein
MLETVTIAIASGAFGLLAGALIPAGVAYSILFLRRHGRKLRTFLRLGGRLLVAMFVLGAILSVLSAITGMLGASVELQSAMQTKSYFIGVQIGFWGGIVALIVGIRKGRADRGATQTRVSQS